MKVKDKNVLIFSWHYLCCMCGRKGRRRKIKESYQGSGRKGTARVQFWLLSSYLWLNPAPGGPLFPHLWDEISHSVCPVKKLGGVIENG